MYRRKRIIGIAALMALTAMIVAGYCIAEAINACFYFIGGDLEADSGAASEDIKEIARAETPDDVRVFMLTGGTPQWKLNFVPSEATAVEEVLDHKIVALERWPDAPVGSAETLARYMRKCRELSPAERCILILWGHGADGTLGVGYDLLNCSDTLTLLEIREALADAGIHPDIIGFDACAMATLESCWILADCCDYLVASTEPEDLTGWQHHQWMRLLSDDMRVTAETMVERFNEDCLRKGKKPSMQALDLRGFRERYCEKLVSMFEKCDPVRERKAITEIVAEDGPLTEALSALLDGGDFLVGKYGSDNIELSKGLDGIGELYYRWLTTK